MPTRALESPAVPTHPAGGIRSAPLLQQPGYRSVAAGLTGAAFGWLAGQLLTDLGAVINSYVILDLATLALLGGSVGGLVRGVGAVPPPLRREGKLALEAALGGLIGALAATTGGLLGLLIVGAGRLDHSGSGFLIARLLVWGLAAASIGVGLALGAASRDRSRFRDGALGGLAGGLLGALLFSLPGPTQVWQLLGFLFLGAGVGYGAGRSRPG